jgi:hypothetical protein
VRIKLSAYWWCQIIGWSCFLLAYVFMYLIKKSDYVIYYFIILFLLTFCGFYVSHLMHLFWFKSKVFRLKVLLQIVFIFFSIAFFSAIYSIITTAIILFSPLDKKEMLGGNILTATIRNTSFYFIVLVFGILFTFFIIISKKIADSKLKQYA